MNKAHFMNKRYKKTDGLYDSAQCKRMMVDPYVPGEIEELYPFLKEFVDEERAKPDDKLPSTDWNLYWRWVALVYDPYSPMLTDCPDMEERKKKACDETGVPPNRDEEYRLLALKYVIRCKKPVATLLTCTEMLFADYARKVITVNDKSDKDALQVQELQGKLLDRMYDMMQRINELRNSLLGGDEKLEETYDAIDWSKAERVTAQTRKKA